MCSQAELLHLATRPKNGDQDWAVTMASLVRSGNAVWDREGVCSFGVALSAAAADVQGESTPQGLASRILSFIFMVEDCLFVR